ncbi:hypothetical protein VTO42DRAFT_3762 [Malbranchea cinnamomea]
MNTIRSTWIGWGALCVAGGGAYVFAKRAINADRAARHEQQQKRKEDAARLERQHREGIKPPLPVAPTPSATSTTATRTPSSVYGGGIADVSPHPYQQQHHHHPPQASVGRQTPDDVANPSQEAAHDPAPTRHEPDTEAQWVAEKGKYEATEPFRSRKGNRLS